MSECMSYCGGCQTEYDGARCEFCVRFDAALSAPRLDAPEDGSGALQALVRESNAEAAAGHEVWGPEMGVVADD